MCGGKASFGRPDPPGRVLDNSLMSVRGPKRISAGNVRFLEVKQTLQVYLAMSANDPKRTWRDYRQNRLGGTAHKGTITLVEGSVSGCARGCGLSIA
jgi:hypothetical protein